MIRLRALLLKEFIQMRRDRLTFGLMIGIPIFQLLMFGFCDQYRCQAFTDGGIRPVAQRGEQGFAGVLFASGYFDLDIFMQKVLRNLIR